MQQAVEEARPQSGARTHRTSRFYRPELDALRFLAFAFVLLRHGARIPIPGGRLIQECGSFGLSLFFFLSAFLITELLIREREQTGTVHLKAFYLRRILRIWPLYFTGVFLAVVAGRLWPDLYWITKLRLLSMVLFFTNWYAGPFFGPFTPLWSISIEEQFYAVWPAVIKHGRVALKVACGLFIVGAMVTLSIQAPRHNTRLWLNTFVEFLFFGTGALVALAVHRRRWSISIYTRIALAACAPACWVAAQAFGNIANEAITPSAPLACSCYLLADAGCAALLLAAFGAMPSAVPRSLIYLGRISYGLYVFHKMFILILSHLGAGFSPAWTFLLVDGGTLVLSIGVASLSYRYVEQPINRIKERFAIVPSRPA